MERILLIDDDPITIAIVRKILETAGYIVVGSTNPAHAVHAYRQDEYELIITDLNMPEMSGHEVVEEIRRLDADIPMIVLTGSVDIDKTVGLYRHGVIDYIIKPVVPDDLLHRVRNCIDEHELRLHVRQVEEEKQAIESESRKLVNWRMLYAYKDINQTEQMIKLLTRTVNAEGGFAWLDILTDVPRRPDGGIELDKDTLDLILMAGQSQKKIIDYLTFINQIPHMELAIETVRVTQFVNDTLEHARTGLSDICRRHGRKLSVFAPLGELDGWLAIDRAQIRRVCQELVVNAIKYSPESSGISLELVLGDHHDGGQKESSNRCHDGDHVFILVKNTPRQMQARTEDGSPIVGIPFDYSELVFDLLFTIENYSTENADEEWPDGTGLYVARKLLGRMKALLDTKNLVDYTGDRPKPLVQFAITIPAGP